MLEAISEETRPARSRIVELASQQAMQGAHYLTGCFGATPGDRDNVRRRPLTLGHHLEWNNLAVCAAEHTNMPHPEPYRCAGRYERTNGQQIATSALQRRVREYIEANRERPLEQWPSFDGMGYPRKAWDEFGSQYLYVLGEDCRNKRHFDCIGFVNWVLTQVKGSPVTYGSALWIDGRVAPVTVQAGTPQLRNLEPGDLLVRVGGQIPHIVIAGNNNTVIEAAGIRAGVIKQECDVNRFTHHCRIRNRWLPHRT